MKKILLGCLFALGAALTLAGSLESVVITVNVRI